MKKILSVILLSLLSVSVLTACKNQTTTTSLLNDSSKNQVVNIYTDKESISTTTTVEDAVEKVYDSVVVINAYTSNGYSSGSGVVIGKSEDYSYIVTCHHVIEDCNSYEVILSNQEVYSATLVGGDPTTDIAVLKIEKTDLPVVSFINDSSSIKLGSTAIAIGNPLGILANTVTVGTISYVNREITASDGTRETLIQTDAAINSGNSGGGLFNTNGDLIGIVSSKYASSGIEGLGFAVPANTVKNIVTDLLEKGYVEGRYDLGLTLAEGYTRGSFMGQMSLVVYVSKVDQLGCAYGLLQANDIITSISIDYLDSEKEDQAYEITSLTQANNVLNAELSIGDTLTFNVTRSNSTKIITIELTQYVYK